MGSIASHVSDPKHPSYGNYLSSAALSALTAPSAAHVAAVETWLSESNVPFNRVGELVEVKLTATSAAKLLSTTFHHAANDATGQAVVRADDYLLPAQIEDAVAAVFGMHGLPLPPRKPAMGHLNPFLYQNPDAFTDITVGTNAIDRGGQKVPYGYACAPGWDPATGLGTPKFGKMLTAAMKAFDVDSEIVV